MEDITIRQLEEQSHALAKEKGWWDDIFVDQTTKEVDDDALMRLVPEKLALLHSEVSEMLEEFRTARDIEDLRYIGYGGDLDAPGKPCGFAIEAADLYIRLGDLLRVLGIDGTEAVRTKHEYNKTREWRHGGKRA